MSAGGGVRARAGAGRRTWNSRAAREFRILGPLEVLSEGRRLDLAGHRQRAVLAPLLIEANRVVSASRLVDLLWDGRPPPRALGTLRAYLSNLRRILEPGREPGAAASVLASRPAGYVLRVEPEQVDASRFEARVRAGGDASAAGDLKAARRLLGEALALWLAVAPERAGEARESLETALRTARRPRAVPFRQRAEASLARLREAVSPRG